MTATTSGDEIWRLLAASRLLDEGRLAEQRGEFDRRHGGGDAVAVLKFLGSQKLLTRWQARRLLKGRDGPFFLGDYRLLDKVPTPFTSAIFQALHEPSGREVSLVVLDRAAAGRVEVWTGIVKATTIAHQATDPVLSRTWALEQAGGNRIVVCEHLPGPTLADEIAGTGPLPVDEAGRIVFAVARAVAELHALGGIHGGVGVHTIHRSEHDRADLPVRLLQFPLCGDPLLQPPRLNHSQAAALGQRICFVAPELARPGSLATTASDVYAVGCLLSALVTGMMPNWKGDPQRTLARAAASPVEPNGPGVPPPVRSLIGYLTAPDPAARYASATEAASAIAACFGFEGLADLPAPPPPAGEPAAAAVETPAFPSVEPNVRPTLAPDDRGDAAARAERPRPRRRGRRSAALGLAGTGIAGVVMAIAAVVIWTNLPPPRPADPDLAANDPPPASDPSDPGGPVPPPDRQPAEARPTVPAAGSAAMPGAEPVEGDPEPPPAPGPRELLVDDDSLPWGSPTSGSPPSLDYVPAGSQVVLVARPASLLADPEGRRFVEGLGPEVGRGLEEAARLAGVRPEQLTTIRVGWSTDASGEPVMGLVLEVASRIDPAAMGSAWQNARPVKIGEETIYESPARAYWLPRAAGGTLLVVGRPETIRQGIDFGASPPLPPDLELLTERLDGERQLTLLGSPSFLVNDGRVLLSKPMAAVAAGIARFFGEQLQAAAISLHLGDAFYAEIDAVSPADQPPQRFAETLAGRLESVVGEVEDHCFALAGGYGMKLVGRLPTMARVAVSQIRHGGEGRLAVLNCYLPAAAAHNLALAGELAMAQSPGAGISPPQATSAAPKTTAEKLQMKLSLVFAKDNLERSIQMLSEETGVEMEILGGDLQLEGITKNQSFGLDERDKPADAILRTILAKANPDGKLVYVIRRGEGGESLAITTRAAVAKRGETLPPGFEAESDDTKKKGGSR